MGILYIAYGSNLNIKQMKHRCPDAKLVGNTQLDGYRLLFRGGNDNAVATVEPTAGSLVPVLIWEISDYDHMKLDRYEGWPNLYHKEIHIVGLNGKQVAAMIYVISDGHTLGAPSAGYFNTILEGYESAKFDKEILLKAISNSKN